MSATGKRVECETVKRAKLAEILRRDYVQTAIMVVIIIGSFVALLYGLRVTFKTEYPLWAVASGSMRPTLQVGDLIVVQGGLDASEIKAAPKPEGDIIVFRRRGVSRELIVHRAVDKENRDGVWYFRTQGDANSIPDAEEVSQYDVVGKVVGRMPWWGHISLFFEPFERKVALIVLWVVFLILLEFIPLERKLIKEGRSETKAL